MASSSNTTFFLLTLYLQQVLGYTPLEAGIAYLPLAAAVAAATALAQRLMPRFGPRPFAAAGLAIAGVGLVVLSRAPVAGDYLADVLPALLPVGFGAGLAFPSITAAALARVDEDAAGLASGLLSTAAQIAGALAIAILVAVVSERSSDLIGAGSAPLAAQVGGFQLAFLIAAGLAQLGSLVAMVALPRGKLTEVAS
jgi:MFS family permease